MKRLCLAALLFLLAISPAFADSEDTAVFRTRMLPDNEVPPIAAAGNSAAATITVHASRDGRGNISSASVIFDIDYTVTAAQTFTGLHIHNGATGIAGPVVINTGISGSSPVAVAAGSGRISRTVDYSATDTVGLGWVTGLLATPENYYVNIHTTVNPGGFMRGQFQATHLVLRPIMSPAFEVPAVAIDAEGAALVDITVTRDANGAITSGTVVFDVNYRFPTGTPVTLTGLHLHNAATGVNGPVVIDSGLNSGIRAVTVPGGVGNIFRIAEIPSTDTAGIAALTGLMADPTQFYINMHTSVNTGGVMRGQLSKNVYVFFNTMNGAEEVPATNTGGIAYSMTYVRADRDSTGNIVSGAVSFNLNFNMNGGPVTFTGLHIHNGKFGVSAGVVINTGIGGGTASVLSDTGVGSISRLVNIDSSNQLALDSLRGLIQNPELYYVNIHTTVFSGGVIRAQLAQETYHFKANMSTANEVPPITTATTSATGWITAKVNRDANGTIVGGTVTFDVNYTNDGPITFTGLHIHYPGQAGVNASVVINTGVGGGAASVDSPTGSGNITRVVTIDPTNATQLATLSSLISAPDNAYVNIHTTTFGGGVARSQMFPIVNVVPQAVGGGSWLTTLILNNPSATTAVQGTVNFFQSNGSAMPDAITDPNVGFLIPPSGTVTVTTSNAGTLTGGFARVFSNGNVNVTTRYNHPSFIATTSSATTVTSRSVSLPVAVGGAANQNTGVALLAGTAGTLTLSLRDGNGTAIAGGSRTIDVTAGQQIASFIRELLPGVTQTQFTGTLTITTSAGTISVLALQFDGSMTPVTVTALP
jgi:CHRD domain-containing protein